MSISIPGRTVVFDYGEVISLAPSEPERKQLAALAGVRADIDRADIGQADVGPADRQSGTVSVALEASAFWHAYWASRDALDGGSLSIRDYWRGISDRLGQNWSDAQIHRLWLADYRSWLSVDDDTLDVLVELKAGGTRLALLSNAGKDFGSYFRHGALADLFDDFFVSGELGLLKPDAQIFTTVQAELGITAAQMIFIDNKEVNVRGAEATGAVGHVFVGARDLRDFLTSIAAEDLTGPRG